MSKHCLGPFGDLIKGLLLLSVVFGSSLAVVIYLISLLIKWIS